MARKKTPAKAPSAPPPPDAQPDAAPVIPDVAAAPVLLGPTVLIEARSGPYLAVIDDGSRDGEFAVRIGGQRFEHVSEDAAGRWIYRQG